MYYIRYRKHIIIPFTVSPYLYFLYIFICNFTWVWCLFISVYLFSPSLYNFYFKGKEAYILENNIVGLFFYLFTWSSISWLLNLHFQFQFQFVLFFHIYNLKYIYTYTLLIMKDINNIRNYLFLPTIYKRYSLFKNKKKCYFILSYKLLKSLKNCTHFYMFDGSFAAPLDTAIRTKKKLV